MAQISSYSFFRIQKPFGSSVLTRGDGGLVDEFLLLIEVTSFAWPRESLPRL